MTAAAVSAALSIPLGALLGVLYDTVRLLRLLFGITVKSPFGGRGFARWLSFFGTAIGDLLFCVLAGAILCAFFFLTGDGRMRAYGLLGAALGFFCYYHTVGRLVIGAAEWLHARAVAAFKRLLAAFCRLPMLVRLRAYLREQKKKRAAAAAARRKQRQKRKKGGIRNGI